MKLCQIFESIDSRGAFKAIMLAGSPGAGKTFFSRLIKQASQSYPAVIDIDQITELRAKKLGLPAASREFWKEHGEDIKRKTIKRLALILNEASPLIFDGTGRDPATMIRRKRLLEALGYDVLVIFVNTPLDIARKRNRQRSRVVPDDFIEQAWKEAQQVKEFYSQAFENYIEVDNRGLEPETFNEIIKEINKFFSSPVKNEVGRKIISELRKKKKKTISESGIYTFDDILRYANAFWPTTKL